MPLTSARAQAPLPTPTPVGRALNELFFPLTLETYADVEEVAGEQIRTRSLSHVNAPTSVPAYEWFRGEWTPTRDNLALAILSDDGSDVFINGTRVLERRDKGQGFHSLSDTLTKIEFPGGFTKGETYQIEVAYSNVIHGNKDLDGATLFVYGAPYKISVEAKDDHLEADGRSQSQIKVKVTDTNDKPMAGVRVLLKATFPASSPPIPNAPIPGTLLDAQMRTDSNGQGYVDSNDNRQRETEEKDFTIFTTGKLGGWATIAGTTTRGSGAKEMLLHKVEVKDFAQPKLIAYQPDSSDAALASPQISFTLTEKPSVTRKFKVTLTIYPLTGHESLCTKTLELASGAHSIAWTDLFTFNFTGTDGKVNDPGEGLYPFQIEAVPLPDAEGGLDKIILDAHKIEIQTPKASDYKASKSLTIKPKPLNAYSLSYDETKGKTFLTYLFDIETSATVPVAPTDVRIDIYDPDYQKTGTVAATNPPVVTTDGRTFFYLLYGEVDLSSAGDYHFVVETKHADQLSQGKDAGKWALEQNSLAAIPPYVVFGGQMPAANPVFPNGPSSGDLSWGVTKTSDNLQRIGFAKTVSGKKWWHPNLTGPISPLASAITAQKAIGITKSDGRPAGSPTWDVLNWAEIHSQTMQYNGVWVYMGHGGGSTGPDGGRIATFFYSGDPNMKSSDPEYSTGWSYLIDTRTAMSGAMSAQDGVGNLAALDELPRAYVGRIGKTFPVGGTSYLYSATYSAKNVRLNPLNFSNLAVYIGCGTSKDIVGTGLVKQTVQLGARATLGIRNSISGEQGEEFVAQFFDRLRRGDTLEEAKASAEAYAQFDGPNKGQYAVIVYRNPTEKGTMKLRPEWGDPSNAGPEQ